MDYDPRTEPLDTSANASRQAEASRPAQRAISRSRGNRVIAGVCGGLGRYLGVDPVLVRIAFVALVFAGGSGFILYLLAWIVMPEESETEADAELGTAVPSGNRGRLIAGGVLIALGAFLLIRIVIPWFDERVIWAVVLIGLGVALIARGARR